MYSLVGMIFHRWKVLEEAGKDDFGAYAFKCKCECGNEAIIRRCDLLSGKALQCRPCGYKYKRNNIPIIRPPFEKGNNYRHGLSKTRTYDIWCKMIGRCNSDGKDAKWYKSRGITVCDDWKQFVNFYLDMGECPPGMMIDRINNDYGYYKENCRWVTPLVSSRNRRNVKKRMKAKRVFRTDLPDMR